MSFRIQPAAPARPNRCQLFGPGSKVKLFEKMAASAADVINLDLEDSVAPDDKDQARANVIEAINSVDWGSKYLSVRINGLDTPYWYRDVVDILEQAGERLDQIMPKEEWGVKRVCPTTGKRFYDLNKNPIVSPYTGEVVELDTGKTRMIEADAEDAATLKAKENLDTDDVVLEDDEDVDVDLGDDVLDDDDDDDNVSLDDIADMSGRCI